MPRNSQGLYTLPAGNPVVPNTLIEANWANPTMDDIAAALTGSLPRDGSAPMTGPLTLASGAPTQPRHAVSKGYMEQFLAYATGMPVGAVFTVAGSVVPPGTFECNGQAINRTTYASLFATIGTTYGTGDGSTTFNVPDLRDYFIRGKGDARAVGSKQAASLASHTHPTSDPGHVHSASQAAHSHTITTGGHNHAISDPGHVHGAGFNVTGSLGVSGATPGSPWIADTNASQTGISIVAVGDLGGSTNTQQPTVSVVDATTGLTIGAAGGAETVPQNFAMIYVIKAVDDVSTISGITGIDTSDAEMISVNNGNPIVPELVIHSNVAFGTVKLDAGGKVPLTQMPTSSVQQLGFFDASGGQNPSEAYPTQTFSSGDTYAISVGGDITVYDPTTLVSSLTTVDAGGILQYVTGSLTNPTGWYYVAQTSSTIASQVGFTPAGGVSATNVQAAIVEVDSEKVSKTGDTMTGKLLVEKPRTDMDFRSAQLEAATPVGSAVDFASIGLRAEDTGSAFQVGYDATNQLLGFWTWDGGTYMGGMNNNSQFMQTGTQLNAPNALTRKDYVDARDATTVSKDSSTGAANMPAGSQIQRPATPAQGMLRFNQDLLGFEGFNGTMWAALGAASASQVAFTPVGSIAATNVQAAVAEVDNEKVSKSGDTMTGDLIISIAGEGGQIVLAEPTSSKSGYIDMYVATNQMRIFHNMAGTGIKEWLFEDDGTLTVSVPQSSKVNGLTRKDYVDGDRALATNGYQKLPGGLIIQWGYNNTASSDLAVTYPVAFPTATLSVQTTMVTSATTTQLFSTVVDAISASSFSVRKRFQSGATTSGATEPFNWIAIGY